MIFYVPVAWTEIKLKRNMEQEFWKMRAVYTKESTSFSSSNYERRHECIIDRKLHSYINFLGIVLYCEGWMDCGPTEHPSNNIIRHGSKLVLQLFNFIVSLVVKL